MLSTSPSRRRGRGEGAAAAAAAAATATAGPDATSHTATNSTGGRTGEGTTDESMQVADDSLASSQQPVLRSSLQKGAISTGNFSDESQLVSSGTQQSQDVDSQAQSANVRRLHFDDELDPTATNSASSKSGTTSSGAGVDDVVDEDELERGTAGTSSLGTLSQRAVSVLTGRSRRRKRAMSRASRDRAVLNSLGFREELKRDYDWLASWGIALSNIGFLQGTFFGVITALSTGGPSMYAIAWPISGIFMCMLVAVIGEMASTYPVAGAMFTYSFRLCRSTRLLNSSARYISWLVGSFLLCAHILVQILLAYQLSHTLLGAIALYTDFTSTFWEMIGIAWGLLILCGAFVSSPMSRSPTLWKTIGLYNVVAFVFIMIVLLVFAPRIRSAKEIFTTYRNTTGFDSRPYVYLLGWSLTTYAGGFESCAHLAEDTKRPTRIVPSAMFWSAACAYLCGWVSICILLATVQVDLGSPTTGNVSDEHLEAPLAVLLQTLPRGWAVACITLLLVVMLAQNVAQLLSTSRYIWALARESALPFSAFFRRVSVKNRIPHAANWIVVFVTAPALLLLRIDTSIIGTIILQGAAWSTQFSYLAPIAILLICPTDALVGDGTKEWSLRGFLKPLAVLAFLFDMLSIVVTCFPSGSPVSTLTVSWAPVIAVGILILSSLSWLFYGNKRYAGPIKTTTRWTLGQEAELPSATSRKDSTVRRHQTTSAAYGKTARVFHESTNDPTTPSAFSMQTLGASTRGQTTGITSGFTSGVTTDAGRTTDGVITSDWASSDEEDDSEYEHEWPPSARPARVSVPLQRSPSDSSSERRRKQHA